MDRAPRLQRIPLPLLHGRRHGTQYHDSAQTHSLLTVVYANIRRLRRNRCATGGSRDVGLWDLGLGADLGK